jgi:hypothetical protein
MKRQIAPLDDLLLKAGECWNSLALPRMTYPLRTLAVCTALLASHVCGSAQERPEPPASGTSNPWISGTNLVTPLTLPEMGKWMLSPDGAPAHWLGEIYQGKILREPINVIIVDEAANSAEDAKARFVQAATAAGYPIRFGHSTGYQAYLGGRLFPQIPTGWDDAFSNQFFELSNNHGRIFGPHQRPGSYVLIGAFSTESIAPFRWPGHRYDSFNKARDHFARRISRASVFQLIGSVDLENAIVADPEVSTGDHDGTAALLWAK